MIEDVKVKLTMKDIGQLYREAREVPPPEGIGLTGAPMRGFEVTSADGQYVLTFFVAKNGDVELAVRPPHGSYEAMGRLSYEEIADAAHD